MSLEMSWDGLGPLSIGLSQLHGHGSWLVCEVALSNVQDWSPHMSLILKGSQILAFQLKGWFKSKTLIQEYKNKNTKLISNLCMNYMIHVSNTMWRIKNQPSNSTSCNDNALRLSVLVASILYWGLQVTSSFSTWGCVMKDCFERGIYLKGQIMFEGHWTSILNIGPKLHSALAHTTQI
jgi:hypothetical protein